MRDSDKWKGVVQNSDPGIEGKTEEKEEKKVDHSLKVLLGECRELKFYQIGHVSDFIVHCPQEMLEFTPY